jgi:hypothetical protein
MDGVSKIKTNEGDLVLKIYGSVIDSKMKSGINLFSQAILEVLHYGSLKSVNMKPLD